MLKIYEEDQEFDRFTQFDTETGRLTAIAEAEFQRLLPSGWRTGAGDTGARAPRLESEGVTAFVGPTFATHTRFPRRVYFQITRNCNLECDFCFIRAQQGAAHVPTSAVMDAATYLGQNGLMEVRLTGGEPTTHPDFFDILHKFQEENVYVSVATNGVLSRRTVERLSRQENIWLICSIDGNRQTHNRYRPDTFDRIVRNLRDIRRANPAIRIRLTTVLTRENKGQMFELGQLCQSVGAESITVIPLRPQVRNAAMKEHMVTATEFRQVIEDLVATREKLGIRFTTTIETDYIDKIYKDPVFRKRSSCAAGREGTNLDYDPRTNRFIVYGCSYCPAPDLDADPRIRQPFLAGEFPIDQVEAFGDIWQDDSAWTLFRDLSLKSRDCHACEYFASHTCVGSCPIQNLDYGQIRVEQNLLTQLRHQIANTSEWYCYKKIMRAGV